MCAVIVVPFSRLRQVGVLWQVFELPGACVSVDHGIGSEL